MSRNRWIRKWSTTDWDDWINLMLEQRKRATEPPKRSTTAQRHYLAHARMPAKTVAFVTRVEASYLIDRLKREHEEFLIWRRAKESGGHGSHR